MIIQKKIFIIIIFIKILCGGDARYDGSGYIYILNQ